MAGEQAFDLSELLTEGIRARQLELRESATTQPFTSIADEYRKKADLSQKYRKITPTCTAPVMRVAAPAERPLPLPEQSPSSAIRQPMSPSSNVAPTAVMTAPDASINDPLSRETDGDYRSEMSMDTERESSEPVMKEQRRRKRQGRTSEEEAEEELFGVSQKTPKKVRTSPTQKAEPILKAKTTRKAKSTPAPKAKPPQNEENDLDIQEEELKKLSVFELTSAFRRKAGVRLNSEERRLVGV